MVTIDAKSKGSAEAAEAPQASAATENAKAARRRRECKPLPRAPLTRNTALRMTDPASLQCLAGADDPRAGFLQRLGRGRVGDAEVGREAEGRALHRGDTFRFQQIGHEIVVGRDLLAFLRG